MSASVTGSLYCGRFQPLFGPAARQRAIAWRDQLLAGPELVDTLQAWAMGKSQ